MVILDVGMSVLVVCRCGRVGGFTDMLGLVGIRVGFVFRVVVRSLEYFCVIFKYGSFSLDIYLIIVFEFYIFKVKLG